MEGHRRADGLAVAVSAVKAVRVKGPRAGRRRAGRDFGATPVELGPGELELEELEAIVADPVLRLEFTEDGETWRHWSEAPNALGLTPPPLQAGAAEAAAMEDKLQISSLAEALEAEQAASHKLREELDAARSEVAELKSQCAAIEADRDRLAEDEREAIANIELLTKERDEAREKIKALEAAPAEKPARPRGGKVQSGAD